MNIAHLPSKADMTLEDLFITVYCFVEESYCRLCCMDRVSVGFFLLLWSIRR